MHRQARPQFRPNLVSLEERVVPAWWMVTAPTPPSGTLGDTGATHSGELTFRSDYTPDAAGKVTVWADSPTSAVVAALAGTITVTLGDEEPTDIVFDADTVGTVADHKAFAVSESNGTVSLAFEDMAGMDGCDYDYNDRSWGGVTVSPAPSPSVSAGTYTLAGGEANETATVTLTVTAADPDHLLWRYSVHNNNLSVEYGSFTPGIDGFSFTAANVEGVSGMASTMAGWVAEVSPSTKLLTWHVPELGSGPYLAIGGTAEFTFLTPPAPVSPAWGQISMGGHYVGGRYVSSPIVPEGPMEGPGEVKVVITYADSTEVTDKDGLRVAKLEKAFYKVPNEDKFELVRDPVAKDKNRDFIDDDPDRFYVWVYDPAKWAKTDAAGTPSEPRLQTGITTLARADAGKPEVVRDDLTMVDCLRFSTAPGGAVGTGWYRSDSQIFDVK